MKPLGAGIGDYLHANEKFSNRTFLGADSKNNCIAFGDRLKEGASNVFDFPEFVATAEYS